MLVTPGGDSEAAYELLGESGRTALQQWVADGGRFVGIRGGTEIAAQLGLTTAELVEPTSDVPGSLVRAKVDAGPLAKGVGRTVWSFFEYDWVMHVADPDSVAIRYPTTNSPAWFVSGYEEGASELARTAVVADEKYGDGRVVVFAGEPNFRGFTDGMQKVLWNAVYGRNPAGAKRPADAKAERADAKRAANRLTSFEDQMVVTVRSSAAAQVERLLASYGVTVEGTRVRGSLVRFRIDTGSGEESPYARRLASDLTGLGRAVVTVRVP